MRHVLLCLIALSTLARPAAAGDRKYAPFSEYEMARDAEVALARSAAPETISARATIKVLTHEGFQVAVKGDNGFVCFVMRSWSAAPEPEATYYARLRAPICLDPVAARTVAPAEELRTRLGLQGRTPDEIARDVAASYGRGELPKREGVAFGYMWSADQDTGPGAGAWHPHMMVYAPYYENSTLGGNEVAGHAPFVLEAGGSPFSIVIIRVDDSLAIKADGP